MKRKGEETRIRGILVPVAWDEKGNALRIAIFAPNEEEYLLEEGSQGKCLLSLMQKEVEVKGIVREEDGQKIMVAIDCEAVNTETR